MKVTVISQEEAVRGVLVKTLEGFMEGEMLDAV